MCKVIRKLHCHVFDFLWSPPKQTSHWKPPRFFKFKSFSFVLRSLKSFRNVLTLFHVDWDPGGEWILSLSPPHVDRKLIMSFRTLGKYRDLGTALLYKVPSNSTGKDVKNVVRITCIRMSSLRFAAMNIDLIRSVVTKLILISYVRCYSFDYLRANESYS